MWGGGSVRAWGCASVHVCSRWPQHPRPSRKARSDCAVGFGQAACEKLNLAPHVVGTGAQARLLWGPADIEGHVITSPTLVTTEGDGTNSGVSGDDGGSGAPAATSAPPAKRLCYVLDVARLFPPLSFSTASVPTCGQAWVVPVKRDEAPTVRRVMDSRRCVLSNTAVSPTPTVRQPQQAVGPEDPAQKKPRGCARWGLKRRGRTRVARHLSGHHGPCPPQSPASC